jgi:hypothetical protein
LFTNLMLIRCHLSHDMTKNRTLNTSFSGSAKCIIFAIFLFFAKYSFADFDRADTEPNSVANEGQKFAWKASIANYISSDQTDAVDLNLRANTDTTSFWIGDYKSSGGFEQVRTGFEQQTQLRIGRLISSLQFATKGFAGGSVTWDLRQGQNEIFAPMIGWGRTNLKPYYNINFDPNDSVLYGGTVSLKSQGMLTLFQVKDDRLNTNQTVTHVVYRNDFGSFMRWTVDLFRRKGAESQGSDEFNGSGLSVGFDAYSYGMKIVNDRKSNFTNVNMTRVVGSVRF